MFSCIRSQHVTLSLSLSAANSKSDFWWHRSCGQAAHGRNNYGQKNYYAWKFAEVLADEMMLVEKEVPEEISKSRSLARSLSLHKLSFLHTQTNDEQGGLMKVENEALEVPRRRV